MAKQNEILSNLVKRKSCEIHILGLTNNMQP